MHNIFRGTIITMLIAICVVFASPFLNVNGLIYPPRIDSVFFSQQEALYEKYVLEEGIDSGRIFIYNPAETGISYHSFEIEVDEDIYLRGWIAGDTIKNPVAAVLFIPDISEGRIHYLADINEFVSRGFVTCVVELRGQGNSDGERYDIGNQSANDISLLIDELELKTGFDNLAVMGNRTGAMVALQAALIDDRIKVLVVKNPFISFGDYFTGYAINYWGPWAGPLCTVIKRDFNNTMGYHPDSLNSERLVRFIDIPSLYVSANFYTENIARETVRLYKESVAARKRLFIDRASVFTENGFGNSKGYYDKISAFIAASMPPKGKKSRFRRLVEVTNNPPY
jgi:pimeloyl-ACP methyl ester carboxylesterase